jgi:hypothetical protein
VEKTPQNVAQAIFIKTEKEVLIWKKVAPKIRLFKLFAKILKLKKHLESEKFALI